MDGSSSFPGSHPKVQTRKVYCWKTAMGVLTTWLPSVHSIAPEMIGTWTIGDPVIITLNDFFSPTSENVRTGGSTRTAKEGGIVMCEW